MRPDGLKSEEISMHSARAKANPRAKVMATNRDHLLSATIAWDLGTRTACALLQRAKAKATMAPRYARIARAKAMASRYVPAKVVGDGQILA